MNNNKTYYRYSLDEACPICGRYDPDGGVCVICQKAFGVYKSNKVDGDDIYVSQCGSGYTSNTGENNISI